ncbi:MAG: ABC transporter ATP-binding protein [Nitrospinota bacterium]|nr:ABC transporter ATP-binding protein [Nitrospinota bacterium]MDH5677763.1 ABC transporter ATP-binding protein [Nitrospinota bacterium]MDH5756680.1 ABC transporter ATP-binding protein [Nitrospinota bacterium]
MVHEVKGVNDLEKLKTGSILHIQDVYKAYGDNLILDDIDLSIAPGEFCAVVGPSGCGKSTLLRLILGQERTTTGQVLLNGSPIGSPDKDRGIVYQKYSLFPNLRALDNILFGHRLRMWPWQWGARKKELTEKAMVFLRRAGMENHSHKYPHQLSGGQQQRVAVIQALFSRPKILLMDEPFSALDPGAREDMQMFLLELWEESRLTIFFVTHDLEEAAYMGTRLVALSQYYSDERDPAELKKIGAKVVVDLHLREIGQAASPQVKTTAQFGQLIQDIRRDAFDPGYRQHVKDFSLNHPHSFYTLSSYEGGEEPT